MTSGNNEFKWPAKGIPIGDTASKVPVKLTEFHEQEWHPCITNATHWKAYMDIEMYVMEKWLRAWIEAIPYPNASPRCGKTEYFKMTLNFALSCVYEDEIPKGSHKKMTFLLNYYSTRVSSSHGTTMFRGEPVRSRVYYLGKSRLREQPYGLRYRLEMLQAKGIIPNMYHVRGWTLATRYAKMQLPERVRRAGPQPVRQLSEKGAWYRNTKAQKRANELTVKARERYNEYQSQTAEQKKRSKELTRLRREEWLEKRRREIDERLSKQDNGSVGSTEGTSETDV